MEAVKKKLYRIKLTVEVWRNKELIYRNSNIIRAIYTFLQAQDDIEKQISMRLKNDKKIFRCQDKEFDLVKYEHEGTSRTYLKFELVATVDMTV